MSTGRLMKYTLRGHKGLKRGKKVFSCIVTSKSTNSSAKLSFNFRTKLLKYGE
ncbi:hypothetical protein LguiA_013042 [Lonicera macranthoides]